jgi:hypothetical protein
MQATTVALLNISPLESTIFGGKAKKSRQFSVLFTTEKIPSGSTMSAAA